MFLFADFLDNCCFFRVGSAVDDHVGFEHADFPEKVKLVLKVDLLVVTAGSVLDKVFVAQVGQFGRIYPVDLMTVLLGLTGSQKPFLRTNAGNDNDHKYHLSGNIILPFSRLVTRVSLCRL